MQRHTTNNLKQDYSFDHPFCFKTAVTSIFPITMTGWLLNLFAALHFIYGIKNFSLSCHVNRLVVCPTPLSEWGDRKVENKLHDKNSRWFISDKVPSVVGRESSIDMSANCYTHQLNRFSLTDGHLRLLKSS